MLSEDGGWFDTDNIISNEASWLHVIDALGVVGVRGGAYVGVGPSQNFAYMAAVRPQAFIVDIRRDNALQHLLFKALFEAAPTRETQRRNLVIPVVGDLAGDHALRAVGRPVRAGR